MKTTLLKNFKRMSRYLFYLSLIEILFASVAFAGKVTGQRLTEIHLSCDWNNTSLVDVFDDMQAQTDLFFTYSYDGIKDIRVSYIGEKLSVKDLLIVISSETGLSFKVAEDIVYVYDKSPEIKRRVHLEIPEVDGSKNIFSNLKHNVIIQRNVTPDERVIKGTVKDAKGDPLIGANIKIKDSNQGSITDIEGNFSLVIPEGEEIFLEISYIGYHTKVIAVSNLTEVAVVLLEEENLLEEVVVVGYGVQKKSDVTTAVSSLSSDDIQDFSVAGFDQALVGKLAGVQVLQTTGEPGTTTSIKIRGTNSITAGTQPLYVIDGVAMDRGSQAVELINPSDIESVEVLKDASAAAIYGSRGGNGVIIITTRQGAEGQMQIKYDGYFGIQNVSNKIEMLDAYEYAQLAKDGHDNAYMDVVSTGRPDDQNQIRPVGWQRTPPELFPYLAGVEGLTNTDWQNEIFRAAPIQRHTVSFSGGGKKVKYFVSGTYFDQDGIVIHNNFKRYGARLNLTATEGKFNFGLNFTPTFSKEDRVNAYGPYFDQGVVGSALQISPVWSVYNADGSYNHLSNGYWRIGTDYQHNEVLNPVALADLIDDNVQHTNVLSSLYAEYEVRENLKVRTSLSGVFNHYHNDYYRPSSIPDRGAANFLSPSNPDARSSSTFYTNYLSETTLTYNQKINEHNIGVIAGFTAQKNYRNQHRVDATNFPNDLVKTVNAGEVVDGTSTITEWSLLSYLGRVQYDYSSKYLVSAAMRTDGSSRFGRNNRWGYFPSVSVGWRISAEDFMKGLDFIYDMKIRASYGVTGNFQIGNYDHIPRISEDDYILGNGQGALANGIKFSNVANDDLGWETTTMIDVGIDLSLLDGKINLAADYYEGITSDLLLNVPVPLTTGFGNALTNIGEVKNNGFEIALNTNLKLGKINWRTNVNFSTNKNEVLSLGPEDAPIIKSAGTGHAFFITQVGESIGSYYFLTQDGIFSTQAELDQYPHFDNTQVGDFRFIDINGDGQLNVNDDRSIVGSYFPDFTYGITNSFDVGGFDFNFTIQGVQGNEILNLNRRYIANMEGNFNNTKEALNRWQSEDNPGDGTTNRANRKSKGNNGRTSTWHLEDGSYLRLQNMTLGYTLPTSLTQKFHINRLRVYVIGQNLMTSTDYTGYNPEVNLYDSDSLTPGVDYGTYPLARTVSFGLNVGF